MVESLSVCVCVCVCVFHRLDVHVSFHGVSDVSEEEKRWTFELMKSCVKD